MDHRGDLYSVGVIIYELLTGRLPFPGPSSMDMLLAHATEMPPTFAELNLDVRIPQAIEALVFDCLAKDPNDRPQSAMELAELFDTALARQEVIRDVSELRPREPEPPPAAPDATALHFEMEAWMPQSIAIMKLRGFVHDAGGEVIESVPGLIRVRLGGRGHSHKSGGSTFSWLGFGSKRNGPIDLELRLHTMDSKRENHLAVEVMFRPHSASLLKDRVWRDRCTRIFIDVRSYMMGV